MVNSGAGHVKVEVWKKDHRSVKPILSKTVIHQRFVKKPYML